MDKLYLLLREKMNRKLKVLEIARSFYPSVGGLEKFVSDRIKLYDDLGFESGIISSTFNTGKFDYSLKSDNAVFVKQFTPYNIGFNLKKILTQKADIISVNQIGNYVSDYSLMYAHKNKIKCILTPHFYFHTEKFGLAKKLHKKYLSPKLLAIPDKIICFTDYEKDFFVRQFFVPESKISIIPHYFENKEEAVDWSHGNYFLYLGRSSSNKKIDLLITAFDKIKDLSYRLLLTVSGDQLDRASRELVKNNNKIELLGYITHAEKERLLRNASALILPTDFEAFGIVLLEASGFGRPILCSSLQIFDEILNPAGVIYFENDVSSLMNKMTLFIRMNDSAKSEMGNVNRTNLDRFSFEIVKKKYLSLFESLFV